MANVGDDSDDVTLPGCCCVFPSFPFMGAPTRYHSGMEKTTVAMHSWVLFMPSALVRLHIKERSLAY